MKTGAASSCRTKLQYEPKTIYGTGRQHNTFDEGKGYMVSRFDPRTDFVSFVNSLHFAKAGTVMVSENQNSTSLPKSARQCVIGVFRRARGGRDAKRKYKDGNREEKFARNAKRKEYTILSRDDDDISCIRDGLTACILLTEVVLRRGDLAKKEANEIIVHALKMDEYLSSSKSKPSAVEPFIIDVIDADRKHIEELVRNILSKPEDGQHAKNHLNVILGTILERLLKLNGGTAAMTIDDLMIKCSSMKYPTECHIAETTDGLDCGAGSDSGDDDGEVLLGDEPPQKIRILFGSDIDCKTYSDDLNRSGGVGIKLFDVAVDGMLWRNLQSMLLSKLP